jgi:hypothetical protein
MQPKPQQNYPLEKSFARRSRCVGGMTLFAVNRRCSLHDFEIICKLVKKSCALALFYLPPGGIKLRICISDLTNSFSVGGTTTSTDRFSRFLWVKDQRASLRKSGRKDKPLYGWIRLYTVDPDLRRRCLSEEHDQRNPGRTNRSCVFRSAGGSDAGKWGCGGKSEGFVCNGSADNGAAARTVRAGWRGVAQSFRAGDPCDAGGLFGQVIAFATMAPIRGCKSQQWLQVKISLRLQPFVFNLFVAGKGLG